MNGSQLPIFTHEYLGPHHLVEPATLTRLSLGATRFLSAKTADEKIMVRPIRPITKGKRNIKRKRGKAKRTKSRAKGPKPKVSHLAFLPELVSEDRCAIPQRGLSNRLSYLY